MLDHTTIWIGRTNGDEYGVYSTKPSLSRTPNTCYTCNHKSWYLADKPVLDVCADTKTFKLLPWIEGLLDSEVVELQIVFVSKSEAASKPKIVRKKGVKKA